MPWGRLDDRANNDAKLLALSDGAWRMWGCGLIYCQFNLTDGFIPDHAIHTFGVRARNKLAVAHELCTVLVPGKGPLWHQVEGGYHVHDYLDWNDSREDVLAGRAKARGRIERWRQRHQNGDRNGDRNGVTSELRTRSERASTSTSTSTSTTQRKERAARARAQFAERFWPAWPTGHRANRAGAEQAFVRLGPDDALLDEMLAALERHKRSEQWRSDAGKFIPHAQTWLNQRRWEDEIADGLTRRTANGPDMAPTLAWRDECDRLHGGRCGNATFHAATMAAHAEAS